MTIGFAISDLDRKFLSFLDHFYWWLNRAEIGVDFEAKAGMQSANIFHSSVSSECNNFFVLLKTMFKVF